MTLTHCLFAELIDDKKTTANFFGKDFADALMKGRNELPVHYMNMFYFFGDFFCSESQTKREKFVDCILKEQNLSSLISVNMEALMVTVLHTGCGVDWPDYLNSRAYNDWLTIKDGGKNPKPVSSFVFVCFRSIHCSNGLHSFFYSVASSSTPVSMVRRHVRAKAKDGPTKASRFSTTTWYEFMRIDMFGERLLMDGSTPTARICT